MPSAAAILATAPPAGFAAGEWRRDLEVLVAHACGLARAHLFAHPEHRLTDVEAETLARLVRERAHGCPVAYLIGHREFWSLDLIVTPATLIPRPETELLVERALCRMPVHTALRVADIGTGSGAIALALARERPQAAILATDPSAEALAVARQNAALHHLRLEFLETRGVRALPGLFDLLVSNPPYVGASDPCLLGRDLAFEPLSALQAGPEGLAVLAEIIEGAGPVLRPGGYLLLEHGAAQGEAVRTLLEARGFRAITCYQDLAGHDRVTEAHT